MEKAIDEAIARAELDLPVNDLRAGDAFLWQARLAQARGHEPAEVEVPARQALTPFRAVGAAWWTMQTLEVLARVGRASAEEVLERARIWQQLRGGAATD